MNILIVAPHYPFHDRSSGDLRFSKIIEALLPGNKIWFCPLFERLHAQKIGSAENQRYRKTLEDMGINIDLGGPRKVLRKVEIDVVFFEFYFSAPSWMGDIRALQPRARIVIDSVDVHFYRLSAKARLTGSSSDDAYAEKVKVEELAVYRQSDAVIVVSDDDGKLLADEVPDTLIATIPNIHVIHEPVSMTAEPVLTFVGGFSHEPNADAVLYFCREILPLVHAEVPSVVFHIIGNAPPSEVKALASDKIKVLGYVPDTLPYLRATQISVAPLRYGAGMKGKVGEAMSLGIPVVTTTVGIEGFGLTPGENVLVGDTPQAFAQEVIRLLRDAELQEKVRMGGWKLIRDRYSDEVVKKRVVDLFHELTSHPTKDMPLFKRLFKRLHILLDERVLWRIKRT